MPHLPKKPHTRRRKRIILRELQLRREDTAFKRCALRSLDQRFPVQQVVFGDGACGDAFWGIVGEGAVFLEETSLRGCGRHFGDWWSEVGGKKRKCCRREWKVKVACTCSKVVSGTPARFLPGCGCPAIWSLNAAPMNHVLLSNKQPTGFTFLLLSCLDTGYSIPFPFPPHILSLDTLREVRTRCQRKS
jgi:hypothetical protein